MKDKQKLTLGEIQSLRGIVEDVQPQKEKNISVNEVVPASQEEKDRWNYFVAKAIEQGSGTAQTTVYIPSSLKVELENLRNIEELKKVPLSSLIATILDNFIVEHLSTIKELLNEKKSRF